LLDSTVPSYVHADTGINTEAVAVRNDGVPVTFTDNADGTFDLAVPPAGNEIITCDDLADLDGSGVAYRATDTMQWLVGDRCGLSALGRYYGAQYVATEDLSPHLGLSIPEKTKAIDLLDKITDSFNTFWAINKTGSFYYGRMRPEALDALVGGGRPIVAEMTEDDVFEGTLRIEHNAPTFTGYQAYGNINWFQQSTFASSLTEAERNQYTRKGFYTPGYFGEDPGTTSYLGPVSYLGGAPSLYHLSMSDSSLIETLISGPDDTSDIDPSAVPFQSVETNLADWSSIRRGTKLPWTEFVDYDAGLDRYGLEIGEVVSLLLPRYGLSAGLLHQVCSIGIDASARKTQLGIVRRRYAGVLDDGSGSYELREDSDAELREDGGYELREGSSPVTGPPPVVEVSEWFLDNFVGSAPSIGSSVYHDTFTGTSSLLSHTADSGATYSDGNTDFGAPISNMSVGAGSLNTAVAGSAYVSASHNSALVLDVIFTLTKDSGPNSSEFHIYTFVDPGVSTGQDLIAYSNVPFPSGYITINGAATSAVDLSPYVNGDYSCRIIIEDGYQVIYRDGLFTAKTQIDLSTFSGRRIALVPYSTSPTQQYSIKEITVSDYSPGSLAQHAPDIGAAYTSDGGTIKAMQLDGSGFLVGEPTGSYANSVCGPTAAPYSVKTQFKFDALGSDYASIDIAVTTLAIDYLAEVTLTWTGSAMLLILYIYNSGGSTLSTTSVDVTDFLPGDGSLHTIEMFVMSTFSALTFDDVLVAYTDQIPDVVPETIEYSFSILEVNSSTEGKIDYIQGNENPVLSTFLFDTFTDTNGTQLSAHMPEIGGSWFDGQHNDFNSGDPGPEIQSNKLVSDAFNAFTGTFNTVVPVSADYAIECPIVAGAASGFHDVTIYARVENPVAAIPFSDHVIGYMVQFGYDTGFGWRLLVYKQQIGGGSTNITLDTYVPTITPGNTYVVRAEFVGSSIIVKLDGVQRISVTDSDHPAAGSIGILNWGLQEQVLEMTAEYI
jgi:hypothetical protein